jgi:hypothetical protein
MTSSSLKSLRHDVAPPSAQDLFLDWQPVGYSIYYPAFARSFGSASLVPGSPALFRLSVQSFSPWSDAVVVRLFFVSVPQVWSGAYLSSTAHGNCHGRSAFHILRFRHRRYPPGLVPDLLTKPLSHACRSCFPGLADSLRRFQPVYVVACSTGCIVSGTHRWSSQPHHSDSAQALFGVRLSALLESPFPPSGHIVGAPFGIVRHRARCDLILRVVSSVSLLIEHPSRLLLPHSVT